MKLGVVVQARMGSTRLPGKVLLDIGSRPLIGHVIDRLDNLRHSALVVVATSSSVLDDVIETWCASSEVLCFRGSETDVLDRYLQCAVRFDFDHVVRLTADNPFTDIEELDRLLDLHLSGGYDYSHSFRQMPMGVGCEVFTREALTRSHINGRMPNHREHVNEFIEENPEKFRIGCLTVPAAKVAPSLRMTVDTQADWLIACRLAAASSGGILRTEEAIRLCSSFA